MFLVDTNIFLEILLEQEKKEKCKQFLQDNADMLCMTDFSLHSIGVILFRFGKEKDFQKFTRDVLSKVNLLTLPLGLYEKLKEVKKTLNLDLDDAYQYLVAKHYELTLVTMDRDFKKIEEDLKILFL